MKNSILQHFKKNDTVLAKYLKKHDDWFELEQIDPKKYFHKLCREIVSQQLAGKAAEAIFKRFEALFPSKRITPKNILKIEHDVLRNVGMSHAKARYIRNLAETVEAKTLHLPSLPTLDDEEVIEQLTQVKGIGRWTAEMFLMFTLGRENVFSHGDLGLRNAMKKLYRLPEKPTRKQIERIVKKWEPYKTYACLALWRSLDEGK